MHHTKEEVCRIRTEVCLTRQRNRDLSVQDQHQDTNYISRFAAAFRVQELCESRGGRPGLSVLTSLLDSVEVKIY